MAATKIGPVQTIPYVIVRLPIPIDAAIESHSDRHVLIRASAQSFVMQEDVYALNWGVDAIRYFLMKAATRKPPAMIRTMTVALAEMKIVSVKFPRALNNVVPGTTLAMGFVQKIIARSIANVAATGKLRAVNVVLVALTIRRRGLLVVPVVRRIALIIAKEERSPLMGKIITVGMQLQIHLVPAQGVRIGYAVEDVDMVPVSLFARDAVASPAFARTRDIRVNVLIIHYLKNFLQKAVPIQESAMSTVRLIQLNYVRPRTIETIGAAAQLRLPHVFYKA